MDTSFVLRDNDIFSYPEFPNPEQYLKRLTVKAIAVREDGQYGFVTNPAHKCVLLAGGGAETDDLEKEITRECVEELGREVKSVHRIATAVEYRNRDKIQYQTVCFLVEVLGEVGKDTRTDEEKQNGLTEVWLSAGAVSDVLAKQMQRVKSGDVTFYNTAFNVVRDQKFWNIYREQVEGGLVGSLMDSRH
jgi:hypothetical protein